VSHWFQGFFFFFFFFCLLSVGITGMNHYAWLCSYLKN
jgi:hypothetical protein